MRTPPARRPARCACGRASRRVATGRPSSLRRNRLSDCATPERSRIPASWRTTPRGRRRRRLQSAAVFIEMGIGVGELRLESRRKVLMASSVKRRPERAAPPGEASRTLSTKEQAKNPPPAGAQCQPRGNLATPADAAHEHEVRYVGTDNQQEQCAHHAEHDNGGQHVCLSAER